MMAITRFQKVFISITISQILCLGLILYSPVSYGQRNARITFNIPSIPIEEEIEAEIHVSWNTAQQDRTPPTSWSHDYNFTFRAGHDHRTTKRTGTVRVNSRVTNFIIYGCIKSTDSKEIIRFIPTGFFETRNYNSLDQISVDITTQEDFNEALLNSYPLKFNRDRGFLGAENIYPTLRSFELMLDYADRTNSEITRDTYNRIHTFFLVNQSFFKEGGLSERTEILRHVRRYAERSQAPDAKKFYATFLNKLIGSVQGITVWGKNINITDYLEKQLMRLYENHLNEVFEQADISMRKFYNIHQNASCLKLAEKILQGLDKGNLQDVQRNSPKNLRSVLIQTTVCGQHYYAKDSKEYGANPNSRKGGSKFLAQDYEIGRPAINQYVKVCDLMQSIDLLSLTRLKEYAEVARYCVNYSQALGR